MGKIYFYNVTGTSMNNHVIHEENYVSGDIGNTRYWGVLHAILTDKMWLIVT